MAGYNNDVFLMGEVKDDPEFINNEHGEFCKLLIETKNEWKDPMKGTMESRSECFPVFVANPDTLEFIKNYIKRTHFVFIKGVMQSRAYLTQMGETRYALQVYIGKFKGHLIYVGRAGKKETKEEKVENPADDVPY